MLNVILHALYNLSCAQHSPALQTLLTAVNQMPFYDICVRKHISPGTPLYQFLLSQAPLYPIDIYTLAAQHCLEDLAVNTSSHLLSETVDVSTLGAKHGAEKYLAHPATSSSSWRGTDVLVILLHCSIR